MSAMPSPFTSARWRIDILAAPAAGARSEGVEGRERRREVAAPRRERDLDVVLSETDDVDEAVPVHVRKLAVVGVVATPPAGRDAERREHGDRRGEVAPAGREGDHHAALREADDVGLAVPVDVGEVARLVVLRAPAAAAWGEGVESGERRPEVAAAGRERDLDVALSE